MLDMLNCSMCVCVPKPQGKVITSLARVHTGELSLRSPQLAAATPRSVPRSPRAQMSPRTAVEQAALSPMSVSGAPAPCTARVSTLPLNAAHVPYRDSTLTKLLANSLGGSAMTLMIACIGPTLVQRDESLNTLAYAQRAGCITNQPVIQVGNNTALTG